MKKMEILGVEFVNEEITDFVMNIRPGIVHTLNIDHLVRINNNSNFRHIYQKAEYITCDSQLLRILLRIFGCKEIPKKITGSDFVPKYCEVHGNNVRCFLVGGAEESSKKGASVLEKEYGVSIVGMEVGLLEVDGFDIKNAAIVKKIEQSKPNLIVVCLGCPKQELWINKYLQDFRSSSIIVGAGATIEFIAGTRSRAPKLIQGLGLEWAYRLSLEPKRLFRRYLVNDLEILKILFQHLIRGRM